MNSRFAAAFLASAALFAVPASADDSTAMLGAGGIVLTQNADIRMATEDLYLSPNAVKVHYTFANDSGKDIDTIVAFPLPDIDNYEHWESPIGTVVESTPNFVGSPASSSSLKTKSAAVSPVICMTDSGKILPLRKSCLKVFCAAPISQNPGSKPRSN